MVVRLLRWVGSLLVWGVLCLPLAAQAPDAAKPETISRNPPAPQYALAAIAAILILLIICMPTRKRWG